MRETFSSVALLDCLQGGSRTGPSARSSRGATTRLFGLPLPRLDAILAHGQWSVHAVQLVVQSAGIAHGLPVVVPSPKCRGSSAAVGAAQTHSSGGSLN